MTQTHDIEYIEPAKQSWGTQKVKKTYPLDPVFVEALEALTQQVKTSKSAKRYGQGNILESWGMADKQFVAIYKQLNNERGTYDEGGHKQES